MSDEAKLLPCAFCGGEPRVVHNSFAQTHWVKCATCETKSMEFMEAASAVEWWNRRAPSSQTTADATTLAEFTSKVDRLIDEAMHAGSGQSTLAECFREEVIDAYRAARRGGAPRDTPRPDTTMGRLDAKLDRARKVADALPDEADGMALWGVIHLAEAEMERRRSVSGKPILRASPGEAATPDARLRRMLETATARLVILRDRMEACDSGDRSDTGHELSRFEIEGWVEEQRDILTSAGRHNASDRTVSRKADKAVAG